MARQRWKIPLAALASIAVLLLSLDGARADVAFRKKPAPPPSEGTGELTGGGETTGTPAAEGEQPAKPAEPPKMQLEDRDNPKSIQLFGKEPEAAATKPAPVPTGPTPFYEKWQFWALTGGAVVAAVLIGWGAYALLGPQVADCPEGVTCGGAGR